MYQLPNQDQVKSSLLCIILSFWENNLKASLQIEWFYVSQVIKFHSFGAINDHHYKP